MADPIKSIMWRVHPDDDHYIDTIRAPEGRLVYIVTWKRSEGPSEKVWVPYMEIKNGGGE